MNAKSLCRTYVERNMQLQLKALEIAIINHSTYGIFLKDFVKADKYLIALLFEMKIHVKLSE